MPHTVNRHGEATHTLACLEATLEQPKGSDMDAATTTTRPVGKDDGALDAVFAYIEGQAAEFVSGLVAYASHPSVSAHGIGIDEAARLLTDRFLAMGLEAEILSTRGNPVVLARWNRKAGVPTVLLYGHYDVQPPEPLEAWVAPPFEPTIRDGRIYARGIGDNKGQHYAQLLAIESHLQVHGELPCNVVFMLDGEEEIGSPSLAGFVQEHRERLKADLVVIADGSLHPSAVPVVQMGVRGLLNFELHARDASRDLHSGNFGGVVPNAAWTLVQVLATTKSPSGDMTIDGLYDTWTRPQQEVAAVAALPMDVRKLCEQPECPISTVVDGCCCIRWSAAACRTTCSRKRLACPRFLFHTPTRINPTMRPTRTCASTAS